jgi:HEAT repeat protein
MGEYAPLEILLHALDNEDEDVRQRVSYELNDLAEAAPGKFVAATKDDHRAPVRRALMHAIARLGKDAPVELVLAALEDEDEGVRFFARKALVALDVDPAMIPMEPLLYALRKKYSNYDAHWPELSLLAKYGSDAPVEPLLALLGDSNRAICKNAAEALYQTHPEVFAEVARQAEAILRGEPTGEVFASRVQSRIADRVKVIERATPAVLTMIADVLDWPYWEVRMKAAQALGAVQRNIPDRAIRRLIELRHDPYSQAVGQAADEALAEILSRESGMEDE